MRIILLLVLLALVLTSCRFPGETSVVIIDTPSTNNDNLTPVIATEPADWSQHDSGDIQLRIRVPDGWQTYHTDAGIVLAEHMGSADSGGQLEGILIHIFVPDMRDFDMPDDEDVNLAWWVLNQVAHDPEHVGTALVSEPVAFEWDHHDAAYYLLNNNDNTVTLLLALGLPDSNKMVVCHVSAPVTHADRVRPLLPDLLDTLTVNDIALDASALDHLPDPLDFPLD